MMTKLLIAVALFASGCGEKTVGARTEDLCKQGDELACEMLFVISYSSKTPSEALKYRFGGASQPESVGPLLLMMEPYSYCKNGDSIACMWQLMHDAKPLPPDWHPGWADEQSATRCTTGLHRHCFVSNPKAAGYINTQCNRGNYSFCLLEAGRKNDRSALQTYCNDDWLACLELSKPREAADKDVLIDFDLVEKHRQNIIRHSKYVRDPLLRREMADRKPLKRF